MVMLPDLLIIKQIYPLVVAWRIFDILKFMRVSVHQVTDCSKEILNLTGINL